MHSLAELPQVCSLVRRDVQQGLTCWRCAGVVRGNMSALPEAHMLHVHGDFEVQHCSKEDNVCDGRRSTSSYMQLNEVATDCITNPDGATHFVLYYLLYY